jgi:hypothetical protein
MKIFKKKIIKKKTIKKIVQYIIAISVISGIVLLPIIQIFANN